jgi:prolyl oligopeptidase
MPRTRRDAVEEILHGVPIADPYRWLEDETNPEVRDWVAAQNAWTRSVLDAFPERAWIRKRLETYLAVGTLSAPVVRGERLFYSRREGKTNQPVLYLRDGVRGEDKVLLDPNTFSTDGTVALDWSYLSHDGRYLAYGLSEAGSERSTLRVLDVAAGADLPDRIDGTRACSVAWETSGRGFYYTRYPSQGSVPEGEENYHRRVYYHALGNDPAADPLVFGDGRAPDDWPNVDISDDGRWLVVHEAIGWTRAEVYLKDLRGSGGFVPIVEGTDALYSVEPLNDRLLIHTNEGAPTYRVFAADPARPAREHWVEVIPASEDVLQSASALGGRIVAHYLRSATSRLRLFSMQGAPEGEIDLPSIGSVFSIAGKRDQEAMYYGFTSFTVPPRIFRFDLRSARCELWEKVASPVPEGEFTIEQVRYPSRDGTQIPMFIVRPREISKDGSHPCLLTGYGGFNISLTPAFDRDSFVWLERGGIMAIANLRGGGEFGEAWHRSGMLDRKQNVFDDFIAAAEFLVREKFTRPERLAIQGGSNGGLLVGAALTQRPDLYRAVVCSVPLLDMLRYHGFQIARLWIPEYGSPDDPEQFRWLLGYSPYHRVKDGTAYPAVLLMTAESDSRVDPMHARKMAARLQEATSAGDRPILLRQETKAGHGAGKPIAKQLDEQTDIYSFLFGQVGLGDGNR